MRELCGCLGKVCYDCMFWSHDVVFVVGLL